MPSSSFDERDPDHELDPNTPARCPRRLGGGEAGPCCRALVLVRDAVEHGRWHDMLDRALAAPVEVGAMTVVDWPADPDVSL